MSEPDLEGVEGEIHEGEEEHEEAHTEQESEAPDEFVEEESILTEYDPDDFISGAVTSPHSSIPIDLFDFEYSYGYNCHKFFNLCACDDLVVCWSAGSIITFLDVSTKQTWFRRSTTGGTVGSIASFRRDPNYRIAIAEDREGEKEPLIILYIWPQMEIDAVLRDGTANAYAILDFSPDGELLASVGKEPDYNLTIWNWKRHKILLRTSAFSYGVNAVMFSPYCEGQLTTSGAAHIKFWKMAQTFTGLKLQGELGRFGKTEICDVLGVYPMPDEKVLSGCEWGNILVWEAGLVKLEVTQKGRKFCHKAPIIQFMLSPAGDEVTTIARDGCIRAWYWDTVDQADPPEDDPFVELNPVAESCVAGCEIMCLKHQKGMYWYAQDGNGGIWVVELEIDKIECDHRKVISCHAGKVVAMAALRTHPILITAGEDGALHAYNTMKHTLLARYLFPTPITCLHYPPIDVDATSRIIMLGFEDGIMRTLFLHPDRFLYQTAMIDIKVDSSLTIHSDESDHADVIDMISLLKPHSKAITQISINAQRTLLVTCGLDSTIFMYQLKLGTPFTLQRIGYVDTPNNIAYMTWKPEAERTLLLCGQVGLIMEVVLPEPVVRDYTSIKTFKLEFESYKETLVKKHYMRHRPFPDEEDLASIDEEALKAKEEAQLRDDSDEDLEWIGEIELMESESMLGTTITWAEYCDDGVWVVQQGTGALFLIQPGSNKILKFAPFPGAWDEDMTALKFVCEGRYLLVGTDTGYIRVVRMPTEIEDNPEHHLNAWLNSQKKLLRKLKGRRLAKEEKQPIPRIDFVDFYYLPMHDRYTGALTCLEVSHNSRRFYTSGADGNIFAYKINFPEPLIPDTRLPPPPEMLKMPKTKEPSTVEGELMSHEQLKQKEEFDKMMAIANAHKKKVRDQLAKLTTEYNKLIKANRALPFSQQIDVTLDQRPLLVQERELEDAKALTKRKLAHQLEASDLALEKMHSRNIIQLDIYPFTVRAIRDPDIVIRILRQKNLSKAFYAQLEEVYQRLAEAALRGRRTESQIRRVAPRKPSFGPPRVASFLLGLPPKPPYPLKKALKNYYMRLNRHHLQFVEWQNHINLKPDPNAMPPGAAEALKEAEMSIGNRILKTQPEYVAPSGHNTQMRVCLVRKEIYDIKHDFNDKVLDLRNRKVAMVQRMKEIGERMAEIRAEIPARLAKSPPALPQFDEELEFPERHLEVKPEPIVVHGGRVPSSKKSQQVQERRRLSQLHQIQQGRVRAPRVNRFVPITETRPLVASWELLKTRPDQESTAVENELRERRIERHLFEQDTLLADAEVSIDQFDMRLKQLQRTRIRVQETSQLLELHLYQLHREMNVLNRFEMHEDRLAERVYVKLMQVRGVEEQISDCEHRIEEHKTEKENLALLCEDLQRRFKRLVQDNKFADFLRRIFKKKYRPPRIRDDDESSESESSSSSSEEEDEGSLDSRDIGPIRLDPNVCPEGCDRETYDSTYEMRNDRHKHEQNMMEQDRLVDLLKRDIEAHNKIKRKLSVQLEQRKTELREFMLEKQTCLNDVETVVVLRYDQIRAAAIKGCTGAKGLSQTVVFPEAHLTRLRRRVLELQEEIRQQKLRQRINRTHLFRMNVDLRAMEAEATELRVQMRDVLTRKLGKPRKVDRTLDDQLRQMARRHKYAMSYGALPQVRNQLMAWSKRNSNLEKKYLAALNQYSDRLRLTAALQAEVFPRKFTKEPETMVGGYDLSQYQRDVMRLLIVRQRQKQQIKQLEEEIKSLRQKPCSAINIPESHVEIEEEVSDIYLFMLPRSRQQHHKKYFPISPLGSRTQLKKGVNIMMLLFDCLDAMRVSRDEAEVLLREIMALLPDVMIGQMSRYDLVDSIVRKWLMKAGGDPTQYKKQTKAFDTLAVLVDRLVRQQQLEEEIKSLRQKPCSAINIPESHVEIEEEVSDIYLFMLPRSRQQHHKKYFPISPLGSRTQLKKGVNIMMLLFDCLDAMRVSRDEAEVLLREIMALLPDVMIGQMSRYDLVDSIVRKWLMKAGGDPTQYKKQTKAFDTLAVLVDRLVRQQLELIEAPESPEGLIDDLEDALRDMSDEHDKLEDRLGPAIAALLHSAHFKDIDDPENMASLVKSLVDEDHPVTNESLERLCSFDVIEDIKECGIDLPLEDITRLVNSAIEALKAQVVEPEEMQEISEEVKRAMQAKALAELSKVSVVAKPSSHKSDFKRSGGSTTVDYKSILGGGSSTDHKASRVSGAKTTISTDYEELGPRRKQSTMTPIERQSLATRVSTSILGPVKQFQTSAMRSKASGVQIDLPPEPTEETEEEKTQAILDAIKSDAIVPGSLTDLLT
uniref:Cilia- and flagella-associated protein 44 n=1 Tax=Heliothis virescens TaxID=7102 RepID=A0A2A4JET3_HELVI